MNIFIQILRARMYNGITKRVNGGLKYIISLHVVVLEIIVEFCLVISGYHNDNIGKRKFIHKCNEFVCHI